MFGETFLYYLIEIHTLFPKFKKKARMIVTNDGVRIFKRRIFKICRDPANASYLLIGCMYEF